MKRSCRVVLWFFAVVDALTLPNSAHGQAAAAIADAIKEPGWSNRLERGSATGWNISGDFKYDDGILVLGGPRGAKLSLTEPLGEGFKLFLEYKFEGPVFPQVIVEERRFMGKYTSSRGTSGSAGVWYQHLVASENDPGMGGFVLREYRQSEPGLTPRFDTTGSLSSGANKVTRVEWIIPSGSTMYIRELQSKNTPPPSSAANLGVVGAIAILAALFLGMMLLGWWINRKKPRGEVL